MKLEVACNKEDNVLTNDLFDNNLKQKLEEALKANKDDLQSMRKEGNIYQIKSREDDCKSEYTELRNISTNEVFQESEFPHDIYHDAGSYVKYENGEYAIVTGTDKYAKSPYKYEFCEKECCYHTRFGKINEDVWHLWNYKLEKMFNKAWKNNGSSKNIFTDMRIKTQILIGNFVSKIKNSLI